MTCTGDNPLESPQLPAEPAATEIKAQLSKILSSRCFADSARTKDFLQFVVDEKLAGRGDRLKEHTIAQEVFEKDENFDPKISSIVRVEARRLRAKLAQYYATDGCDDLVRIEIPKGGYAPRCCARDAACGDDELTQSMDVNAHCNITGILSCQIIQNDGRVEGTECSDVMRQNLVVRNLLIPTIGNWNGRVIFSDDNHVCAEIPRVSDAVECAFDIQNAVAELAAGAPGHGQLKARIGIDLGHVIVNGEYTNGDAVRAAVALQELAEPGDLCVSGTVYNQLSNNLRLQCEGLESEACNDILKRAGAYRLAVPVAHHSEKSRETNPVWSRHATQIAAVATTVLALMFVIATYYLTHHWSAGFAADKDDKRISAAPQTRSTSIAVMPFKNLSDDPGRANFAEGLTQQIITALTRFKEMTVTAHSVTHHYRGQTVDSLEVGHRLGVQYVLEGNVRKTNERIRVTTELVEVATGKSLWAETFDHDAVSKDMLEIQDAVSKRVTATVGDPNGVIARDKTKQRRRKSVLSNSAFDCTLRFYAYRANENPKQHTKVRGCLEQAGRNHPDSAEIWVSRAWVYLNEYRYHYGSDKVPYDTLQRAEKMARRALRLEPRNARVHHVLAAIHFHRRRLDEFKASAELALNLNPNDTDVMAEIATYMAFSGDWRNGLTKLNEAIQLNPNHPGRYHLAFVFDHYRRGQYKEAMIRARQINATDWYWYYILLAMICGQEGDLAGARKATQGLLQLHPDVRRNIKDEFRRLGILSDQLIDKSVDGLRKAGLRVLIAPKRQGG